MASTNFYCIRRADSSYLTSEYLLEDGKEKWSEDFEQAMLTSTLTTNLRNLAKEFNAQVVGRPMDEIPLVLWEKWLDNHLKQILDGTLLDFAILVLKNFDENGIPYSLPKNNSYITVPAVMGFGAYTGNKGQPPFVICAYLEPQGNFSDGQKRYWMNLPYGILMQDGKRYLCSELPDCLQDGKFEIKGSKSVKHMKLF